MTGWVSLQMRVSLMVRGCCLASKRICVADFSRHARSRWRELHRIRAALRDFPLAKDFLLYREPAGARFLPLRKS